MMNAIVAKLQDNQYILQQAFKMHCESIAIGNPVSYYQGGVLKKVDNFNELSEDFPDLQSSLKFKIINDVKEEFPV